MNRFYDQLPDHPDERRVRTHRGCANQVQAEFACQSRRLDIQVIQHFHVIGYKPERRNQNVRHAFTVQAPQMIQNVGAEPRLVRRSAAALKDQIPVVESGSFRN